VSQKHYASFFANQIDDKRCTQQVQFTDEEAKKKKKQKEMKHTMSLSNLTLNIGCLIKK
jgi:hypothetical protein